jgi:hypothetical protein
VLGILVTRDNLNTAIGDVTLSLKRGYDRAVAIKEFLDRTPDPELIALGFTAGEVASIKSAFADLAFQKTSAFDSSPHVKGLYGMGF